MINQENRIGKFTSSNIHKLLSLDRSGKEFGAPALTYIRSRKIERKLGRSIDLGASAQGMVWGKIMEAYLFMQEKYFPMSGGYSLSNKETEVHPKYNFWSGSPDVLSVQECGEIKCFYPEAYFDLSEALLKIIDKENPYTLADFKKEFKEVYWQVVSNSIITNKPICTIFAYMPTKEELEDCILMLSELGFGEKIGLDPWQYRFMLEAGEKEELYKLPYIDTEKTDYPNFVKYSFQPPAEDIILLTKSVLDAEKKLNES